MTDQPGVTAERILRGASLNRRVGYLVAGMGGLAAATLVGVLWATEPAPLPVRTQLAFAVFIVVGLAWAGFAVWALARRPLFALDRIVAAMLALIFSTLTTAGAVALAVTRDSAVALVGAAGLGLGLTTLSAVILIRAGAHRRALIARLRELERGHAGGSLSLVPGTVPPDRESSHRPRIRPVGPLALALRHVQDASVARRHGAMLALALGFALLVGIVLLLR